VVPGRPYAVTFNNVLQEETSTGRVVYLPWYGGTLLDDAAGAVYRRLGYTVRRVDVRRVYQLQGALRCVVNVVDRTPSTVIVGKRGDLHRRPVLPGTHRGRPKNRDLPAPMRRGA